MTQPEIQQMIDSSIKLAMDKHNRDATIISAILGFFCLSAFVDGLFRVLGKIPPFLGIDVNLMT
mgnify:CR=1 FL=1